LDSYNRTQRGNQPGSRAKDFVGVLGRVKLEVRFEVSSRAVLTSGFPLLGSLGQSDQRITTSSLLYRIPFYVACERDSPMKCAV